MSSVRMSVSVGEWELSIDRDASGRTYPEELRRTLSEIERAAAAMHRFVLEELKRVTELEREADE